MLLSARILSNVATVNVFDYEDVVEFTEGDGPTIYFQLIDKSVDKDLRPIGRRYMPAAGATLQVVVTNIDDAKAVTRFATQPFASDPSIWSLAIQATDPIKGTATLKFVLTESGKVTNGRADAAVRAYPNVAAR